MEKETSKPEYQPLSEEERRTIVDTLEAFDPDHLYVDMDPEQAASCGGELRDAYDFIGRETDAGAGYVLGFRNSDEDPLNGLSIYSLDDVIEADRWNEDKNILKEYIHLRIFMKCITRNQRIFSFLFQMGWRNRKNFEKLLNIAFVTVMRESGTWKA